MPAEPGARRWRLDLAYEGTDFSGWARQEGLRTVQGELEAWLTRILRLTEPPALVCAGRTDAGVHARGQVAHVDLDPAAVAEPEALVGRLNRVLPGDLVVSAMTPAPEGFDARFSALWRRYAYRLSDGAPVDPLQRRQVTVLRRGVDLGRVNAAAASLLGLRDFGAFCRPRDGATTVRTLLELHAERVASGPLTGVVDVTVRADAFCHSMVRALVGALVEVGSGRRDQAWLEAVAAAGVRDSTVPVLPPAGLTLEEVGYPPDSDLAARAEQARARREGVPG